MGKRSFLQSSYPQDNIGLVISQVLNKKPKIFFPILLMQIHLSSTIKYNEVFVNFADLG